MEYLKKLLNYHPYELNSKKKNILLTKTIHYLTSFHYTKCIDYNKLIKGFNLKKYFSLEDYPFISTRLFKKYDLFSTNKKNIIKVLTSSGTSGHNFSKIYLDPITSKNQKIVLSQIIYDFLGKQKIPMLIIDNQKTLKDRSLFSARRTGILGFSIFGKDITYLLNEKMEIDYKILNNFLKKYNSQNFLIFGFTSIIWDFFINQLTLKKTSFDFKNAIVLHGGGWKKLSSININNLNFNINLKKNFNINKIHNYYGMIEQAGSIFLECEKNFFHTSNFSDIIIRDKHFNNIGYKNKGIVQLISCLPYSYPGHNILTEDEGEIIGEDNCKCGRMGKFFLIHGRLTESELRGCSDTY